VEREFCSGFESLSFTQPFPMVTLGGDGTTVCSLQPVVAEELLCSMRGIGDSIMSLPAVLVVFSALYES
jgi:hypothetical protein